jgi:hypothetical protein
VNALEITPDKQLIAAAGKYLRKKSLTLCMSKFKSSIFEKNLKDNCVHGSCIFNTTK